MKTNHEIAAAILNQIQGEAMARSDYEELLAMEGLSAEDAYTIRKIQVDEAKHTLWLLEMCKKYDGNICAEDDKPHSSEKTFFQ